MTALFASYSDFYQIIHVVYCDFQELDSRPVPQEWIETTVNEEVIKTTANKLPDTLKAVKDEDVCIF